MTPNLGHILLYTAVFNWVEWWVMLKYIYAIETPIFNESQICFRVAQALKGRPQVMCTVWCRWRHRVNLLTKLLYIMEVNEEKTLTPTTSKMGCQSWYTNRNHAESGLQNQLRVSYAQINKRKWANVVQSRPLLSGHRDICMLACSGTSPIWWVGSCNCTHILQKMHASRSTSIIDIKYSLILLPRPEVLPFLATEQKCFYGLWRWRIYCPRLTGPIRSFMHPPAYHTHYVLQSYSSYIFPNWMRVKGR